MCENQLNVFSFSARPIGKFFKWVKGCWTPFFAVPFICGEIKIATLGKFFLTVFMLAK
jgi:hypothetical protein